MKACITNHVTIRWNLECHNNSCIQNSAGFNGTNWSQVQRGETQRLFLFSLLFWAETKRKRQRRHGERHQLHSSLRFTCRLRLTEMLSTAPCSTYQKTTKNFITLKQINKQFILKCISLFWDRPKQGHHYNFGIYRVFHYFKAELQEVIS
jgi:hypothetical protein